MEPEAVDEDLLGSSEKRATPSRRTQWLPLILLPLAIGLVIGAHFLYEQHAPAHEKTLRARAHARAAARRHATALAAVCPHTALFPSYNGCPSLSTCREMRPSVNGTVPLLRGTIGWSFGVLLDLHDAHRAQTATDEHLAWRFSATPEFVRGFVRAEDAVESKARALFGKAHPHERLMHELRLPLLTACCLTHGEMEELRRGVDVWRKRQDGLWLPVRVGRLDCWREKNGSATVAAVMDDVTAPALGDLRSDLIGEIERRHVPIINEKFQSFHVPLLAFFSGGSGDGWLEAVGRAVDQVGSNVGMETTIQEAPALARVVEIHGDSYWR